MIFKSFDIEVYISLVSIMIVMSLVVAIHKHSMKTFFSALWSYASVILSDYYSLQIESRIDRILSGIWLMSCTVLLAAFSGLLRELMIRPKPICWIDSWDDLMLDKWKDVEIQLFETDGLAVYINRFTNTTLARNLESRIKREKGEMLKSDHFESGNKSLDKDLDYDGVRDARTAIAGELHYLDIYKQNLIDYYNLIEDIDFHISLNGTSLAIVFLTEKNRLNWTMAKKFDQM